MAYSEAFRHDLAMLIGTDKIVTLPDALSRASRDETHGLKPTAPDAVVFPECHEDVVKIAEICTKHEVPMTPRGAGTGKSGGCVPLKKGVVIDFSRMNRIISINTTDMVAVVEPGLILGNFQHEAHKLGLFYPPDPASLDWCTLGGNVAENAGGPCAVKYGVTKDYVLGLRIVLSDGQHFRIGKSTIKGVTGLDLVSLLCASEGTLAFVTEITLRLLLKPQYEVAGLMRFSSRESAILAVPKIRRCCVVKCLEFMDSISIEALRTAGFALDTPLDVSSLLLVEVDGNNIDQLYADLSTIDTAVASNDYRGMLVAKDEAQRQKLWNMRRQLSEATKKFAKFKISEDVVVPLSNMNQLLEEVDKIAQRHGMRTCAFGHAGDGNLHLQFLFDASRNQQEISALLRDIFVTTIDCKGTLTGEHGVGIAKKEFLPLEQEAGLIELQRQIKNLFDPNSLLNPGKLA